MKKNELYLPNLSLSSFFFTKLLNSMGGGWESLTSSAVGGDKSNPLPTAWLDFEILSETNVANLSSNFSSFESWPLPTKLVSFCFLFFVCSEEDSTKLCSFSESSLSSSPSPYELSGI